MKGSGHRRRVFLASGVGGGVLFLLSAGVAYTLPGSPARGKFTPAPVVTAEQGAPKSPRPEQVPPGALVPKGDPPPLAIFATGDVIGYLEPCG